MPTFDAIKAVLRNHAVGIAGAGGLGSNVAMALVRVGIGKLIVADFDVVSESNLNRQFYFRNQLGLKKVEALRANLLAINPHLQIDIHDVFLNSENILGLFQGVDVMVEAFDQAHMKQLIIEQFQISRPSTPVVVGNGMAGWGNSNDMRVEQFGNIYVCGDSQSEIAPGLPPMAPRVGICAFMQANVVMKILLDKYFGSSEIGL